MTRNALGIACIGVMAVACGGGDSQGSAQDAGASGDGSVQGDGTSPPSDASGSDGSTSDTSTQDAPTQDGATPAAGLHVSGNQILDGTKVVRLVGVNRSGTEYACIQNNGFFDGPSDDASIAAMATWKSNIVRVPLNEDCWLAINNAPAAYSGQNYKQAIRAYVDRLLAHGLYVILELHWTAPGTTQATGQNPMPDKDHSVTFWSEVAGAYKGMGSVVFELFNEPYPDNNQDTAAAWTCWRDGGTCSGINYQVAGMQELLTAVRTAGANNLVLLGGVQYSNALSQWLTHKPNDPLNNVAAAWHVYNFNSCNNTACYDQNAGAVVAKYPIVTTEIGEDDCSGAFVTTLMGWLDTKQQSYLAWVWDTWGGCLTLITAYDGTANATYGNTIKTHFLAR